MAIASNNFQVCLNASLHLAFASSDGGEVVSEHPQDT